MICTFGDVTDVIWWRELSLPVRAIIAAERRAEADDVGQRRAGSRSTRARAQAAYDQLANLSAAKARAKIVELLQGERRSDRRAAADHPPGEVLREGRPPARDRHQPAVVHQDDRLPRGAAGARARAASGIRPTCRRALRELDQRPQRRLVRQPPALLRRAVPGLVSGARGRQPRLRASDRCRPRIAAADRSVHRRARRATAPISATSRAGSAAIPTSWTRGRPRRSRRRSPGGWLDDPDLFARVFPMDLRPQAHDIIRTWLFSTVLRSHLEFGALPWAHAAISGWVLDPDRKKMSKSKGNVVTPMGLLEEHGADGVRYWAASARPGTDTAFDPAQMKVGRRLAIKLLNASKFVLGRSRAARRRSPQPIDAACSPISPRWCARRPRSSRRLRLRLGARSTTETFFWDFCDNYLELVKSRRYGDFGDDAAGVGERRDAGRAVGAAAAVRAVPAVCRPRKCGRGGSRAACTRAAWPTDAEVLGRDRRRRIPRRTASISGRPRCSRPSARRSRNAACRPARRSNGSSSAAAASCAQTLAAGAGRPAGGVQGRCARARRPAPSTFDVEVACRRASRRAAAGARAR